MGASFPRMSPRNILKIAACHETFALDDRKLRMVAFRPSASSPQGPRVSLGFQLLAHSRGIMHIDHFASHHGWYSGWSKSRLGVGQRSRQQCSFLGCKWVARNQLSDVDFCHLKHVFQKWCKEERHVFLWSTATTWEVMIWKQLWSSLIKRTLVPHL